MIKRWTDKFFKWFCHPEYYPDLMGDLEETYKDNLSENPRNAKWRHLFSVIQLFRPTLMKPAFDKPLINDNGMLKNYFKISVRNLVKQKLYSSINVLGLALGLAAFLIINEYISFERNYDKFFSDSKDLYRLTTDQVQDGVVGTRDAMSFSPSGAVLTNELPEVLNYTTTFKFPELVFRHNDQVRYEKMVVGADSNYLRLFDYQLIRGDSKTALEEPNSLILTESKAKSYFGDSNPIGQEIEVLSSFNKPFKVTGIMADVPENTHYKFDILMSLKSIQNQLNTQAWSGFNYYTYLKMDPLADPSMVQKKLDGLLQKHVGEEINLEYNIQAVESIHLYSDLTFEPEIHGNHQAISFLVLISIFVLIIAWVNYINLSTARAVDRAKEVGLRKVIGAHRKQLVAQFFIESLLINFFGALLAIVIAELTLPFFNSLIEKEIAHHLWNNLEFLITVLIFFLAGTLVSGFYPALVLSGFKPVAVLKGKFRNSKQGVLLRKGLVIFQFAVSITLIAGTLIVGHQVKYMQSSNPGFDMNHVIGFANPRVPGDQVDALEEKLLLFYDDIISHTSVKSAGSSSVIPGGGSSEIGSMSGGVKIVGVKDRMEGTIYTQFIDDRFNETMGLQLLGGRDFNRNLITDSSSVVVNEAFLEQLGIRNLSDAIGEYIQFGQDPENEKFKIIGVINNFNRTTLKNPIEPTCYFFDAWFNTRSIPRIINSVVRLEGASYLEGMAFVEKSWSRFFKDVPLDIVFLDERFERLYKEDKRFGNVFGSFSLLAILVALLGLFGLSSFMAIQRTKEVGVRKVLGASMGQIVLIFYRDFLALIGISAAIGFPTVYLVMNQWLDGYAYRVDFPWWLLVIAGLSISLFALITVGYQTSKVASLDPSKTLKYE
ncbi:MAG: ABC transporter permease [Cyclobacteriaceae bacterium]